MKVYRRGHARRRDAGAPGMASLVGLLVAALIAGCAPNNQPESQPGGSTGSPAVESGAAEPGTTGAGAAQPRPNVMVIEADDMRVDDLRWMPKTRELMMRTGLTFKNSFAPYPLCCPSRASFLTGRYAHNHKVFSHVEPYGFHSFDDRSTLATALQEAGYRTALVGKYLNGYGQQPAPRSQASSLHYVPPGWDEWYAGSDHLWKPGDQLQGGTYDYFRLVQNINGRLQAFPGEYSTDVLGRQTSTLVREFGAKSAPWFVWWTPVAPHHGPPAESDDPGVTRSDTGRRTPWVTPARPEWAKGAFDDQIRHGSGTPQRRSAEKDATDKPNYLRQQAELNAVEREAVAEVTRQRAESLLALDRQIEKVHGELKRTGQLKNTIVMLTSDNGYYLGEHRKRQGKVNLHESALRVPLIITGPGVPRGDRYDPATTIDLAPTIASYAGATLPEPDGVDLRPVIEGGDRGWSRPVVMEAMMAEPLYASSHRLGPGPLNSIGLRLGRWKYVRYSTGEAELYDLAADPLELGSLQRVPAYDPVRKRMRELLADYRHCVGKACSAPLPVDLRLAPPANVKLTDFQIAETERHYDTESGYLPKVPVPVPGN